MLPNLSKAINTKVTRIPGLEIKVTERCTGCKECIDICFVHAISMNNGKAKINNDCRGCGRCVEKCRFNSIKIDIPHNSLDESIKNVSSSVDLS